MREIDLYFERLVEGLLSRLERLEGVDQPRWLKGSTTWDPANLANAAQQSTTVTVTGAAVGDYVLTPTMSVSLGGTLLIGVVTAADTVTVYQINLSGGAVDVASGTLSVRVLKA